MAGNYRAAVTVADSLYQSFTVTLTFNASSTSPLPTATTAADGLPRTGAYSTKLDDNGTAIISTELPLQGRPCAQVVLLSVVLAGIVVFTITGNVLVIASVALNGHLRTTTNYFIANLALADLLLGTTVLPFSATLEVLQYWVFGQIFCNVWAAMDVLCCTASILSLCVISIDRYIGVTRPLQHTHIVRRARAVYVIIGVWILSVAISVAPLIGWKEEPDPDPRICTVTTHTGYVLFSVAGSFYIPCFILLVVYFRIYRETAKFTKCLMSGAKTAKVDEETMVSLRIHTGVSTTSNSPANLRKPNGLSVINDYHSEDGTGRNPSPPNGRSFKGDKSDIKKPNSFTRRVAKFKREKKAAKTLGIVVGVFITCWLPFFLVLPLNSICPNCAVPPLMFKLFFWLGYCNSTMNPIIYTCSSTEFRRAFSSIICCRRCRRKTKLRSSEVKLRTVGSQKYHQKQHYIAFPSRSSWSSHDGRNRSCLVVESTSASNALHSFSSTSTADMCENNCRHPDCQCHKTPCAELNNDFLKLSRVENANNSASRKTQREQNSYQQNNGQKHIDIRGREAFLGLERDRGGADEFAGENLDVSECCKSSASMRSNLQLQKSELWNSLLGKSSASSWSPESPVDKIEMTVTTGSDQLSVSSIAETVSCSD